MMPPGPIEAVASSVCSLVSAARRRALAHLQHRHQQQGQMGTASAAASLVRMGMRLGTLRFLRGDHVDRT